jgi:hypothetical protein|tara:strand:+ start:6351 stop:6803 length:453 start_codon:yes stop_codon:yes gene_type:complete
VAAISLFFLIIGGIFLCLADLRHFDLYIDKANEAIYIRKKYRGTRLSGWSWRRVNFDSFTIETAVRSFWTQSEGSPPVDHHFSGYDITFTHTGGPITPIFLEHTKNSRNSPSYVPPSIRKHERCHRAIEELANALGVKLTMPKDVQDTQW